MKRTFFLLLFILIYLTACSPSDKTSFSEVSLNSSPFGELPNTITEQNWNVEIKLEKNKYKESDEIKLFIKNRGSIKLTLETPYQLEILKDGSWYEMPLNEDIGFTMVGIILEPNSTYHNLIDFESLKYDVIAGKYRVVKTFGIEGTRIALAAMFYIK
jgi:hypothetical protein